MFDETRWYACTLSFDGILNLEGCCGTDLGIYWDALTFATESILKRGIIEGARWSEEIYLQSLWPELLALPHNHAVLCAYDLDIEATKAELGRLVVNYLLKELGEEDFLLADMVPSIQLVPIETQRDFLNELSYITKTIPLVEAYQKAIERAGPNEVWQVNNNVNEFFESFALGIETYTKSGKKMGCPWSRRQLRSEGVLRPGRSSRFIGIRPKDRKKYRPMIYELFERMREDSGFSCEEIVSDTAVACME